MRQVELERFDGGTDIFDCYQPGEFYHLNELNVNDYITKKRKDKETKLFYEQSYYSFFIAWDIEAHTVEPEEFKKYNEIHQKTKKPIPKDVKKEFPFTCELIDSTTLGSL